MATQAVIPAKRPRDFVALSNNLARKARCNAARAGMTSLFDAWKR
jgi:hypothetical protein